MAERVERYRLNAEKCLDLVKRFRDPDAKLALLAMANAWLLLAGQRAKNIETIGVSETASGRESDREMSDPDRSIPCPRCQSPMVWYNADLADKRCIVQHSYQCEKCDFISQSDDQVREAHLSKRTKP